jgi:hypothetical protein
VGVGKKIDRKGVRGIEGQWDGASEEGKKHRRRILSNRVEVTSRQAGESQELRRIGGREDSFVPQKRQGCKLRNSRCALRLSILCRMLNTQKNSRK